MSVTPRPDTIWVNGRIRTMDPAQPWANAIAARAGRIVAIGDDASIEAIAGPGTRRIDMHGRFVMPGLIDSHTHALWGGRRDLFECFVGYAATLNQLFSAVTERARTLPPGEWIDGGPWRLEHVAQLPESPRAILDRIAPDHPVALRDTTQHNMWVNSRALTIAGISRESADPHGGHIGRDANGEPDGALSEAATAPVRSALIVTDRQNREAAAYVTKTFHALGLTGFKEPMAIESDLVAYCGADDSGALKLHVACHLVRQSPIAEDFVPYETLVEWRKKYARPHVRCDYAKLFLDGVAPSLTASFLDPYLPGSAPGYDPARYDADALLQISPDTIADEIAALDRLGFTVKMHAVGDRAVRAGLDGIAAARQRNGASGLRHEIAHTPFIHADDLPRFRELGAVAEVSPKLWFPNAITAGQNLVLGPERTQRCHPIRSLMQAGADLVYGSDWPAAAPDVDPWIGLSGMLLRRHPKGAYPGAVGPGEAITLDKALPLFTVNGARAMGRADTTGALRAGLSADFIVLDRDLYAVEPEAIAETRVEKTVFEGEAVYGG
ncbi:MAG: amidohydrolase [Methylobacteriaceae bacterium]|nr:amidohydrolase [Methylobacteriaceae bacterium]